MDGGAIQFLHVILPVATELGFQWLYDSEETRLLPVPPWCCRYWLFCIVCRLIPSPQPFVETGILEEFAQLLISGDELESSNILGGRQTDFQFDQHIM
jgi:hypothetical protein